MSGVSAKFIHCSAVLSAEFCSFRKNSANPNISRKICSASRILKKSAEGSDMTHSTLSGGALKHTFPGSFRFPPAVNSSAFDSLMSLMALY